MRTAGSIPTVNPAGAAKLLELVYSIVMDVAQRPDRLTFQTNTQGTAPRPREGFRVHVGAVPDYTAELESGVQVDYVLEGSPAAAAGIQAGDVLAAWNGQEIASLADYAGFLRLHEPGETVTVTVRRGSATLDLDVRLAPRPQRE